MRMSLNMVECEIVQSAHRCPCCDSPPSLECTSSLSIDIISGPAISNAPLATNARDVEAGAYSMEPYVIGF